MQHNHNHTTPHMHHFDNSYNMIKEVHFIPHRVAQMNHPTLMKFSMGPSSIHFNSNQINYNRWWFIPTYFYCLILLLFQYLLIYIITSTIFYPLLSLCWIFISFSPTFTLSSTSIHYRNSALSGTLLF